MIPLIELSPKGASLLGGRLFATVALANSIVSSDGRPVAADSCPSTSSGNRNDTSSSEWSVSSRRERPGRYRGSTEVGRDLRRERERLERIGASRGLPSRCVAAGFPRFGWLTERSDISRRTPQPTCSLTLPAAARAQTPRAGAKTTQQDQSRTRNSLTTPTPVPEPELSRASERRHRRRASYTPIHHRAHQHHTHFNLFNGRFRSCPRLHILESTTGTRE